jgi:hypothetical protein
VGSGTVWGSVGVLFFYFFCVRGTVWGLVGARKCRARSVVAGRDRLETLVLPTCRGLERGLEFSLEFRVDV